MSWKINNRCGRVARLFIRSLDFIFGIRRDKLFAYINHVSLYGKKKEIERSEKFWAANFYFSCCQQIGIRACVCKVSVRADLLQERALRAV